MYFDKLQYFGIKIPKYIDKLYIVLYTVVTRLPTTTLEGGKYNEE